MKFNRIVAGIIMGILLAVLAVVGYVTTIGPLNEADAETRQSNDEGVQRSLAPYENVTFAEHEAAVQATLRCMAAAGIEPSPDPARGLRVTRIGGIARGLDMATAKQIIYNCREENNLTAIELAVADQIERAPEASKLAARALLDDCLARNSDSGRDAEFVLAQCLDDVMAETGLVPN